MTTHHRTRTATALAALTLAVAGCSPAAESQEAQQVSAPSTPSGVSTSAAAQESPTSEPGWELLSAMGEGVELPAGDYALQANGTTDRLAVVTAPAGFSQLGGWTFLAADPFHAMGYVTADRVPRDPCGSKEYAQDPAYHIGPSVRALARALARQRGAVTSIPRPVTIDGHGGLFLTYRVGKGIDPADCRTRRSTSSPPTPARGTWSTPASGPPSGSSTSRASVSCWPGSPAQGCPRPIWRT